MVKAKLSRVLFIGNSITKHEPKPEIGWYGCWGMAASAEERDYVHILMKKISSRNPETVFMSETVVEYVVPNWNEYGIGKNTKV